MVSIYAGSSTGSDGICIAFKPELSCVSVDAFCLCAVARLNRHAKFCYDGRRFVAVVFCHFSIHPFLFVSFFFVLFFFFHGGWSTLLVTWGGVDSFFGFFVLLV